MRQFDQSVPHQYSKVLNNRNEITSKESMRLHHTFSFFITFCLSPSLALFPSISHYLFHTFTFIFDLTSLCPFILNHRQPHFQTATIRCETCIRKMHCTIFASCKIASSVEIFRATVYRHIYKLFHTLEFLWLLAVADSFCSFEFRYLFYLFALSGCVCVWVCACIENNGNHYYMYYILLINSVHTHYILLIFCFISLDDSTNFYLFQIEFRKSNWKKKMHKLNSIIKIIYRGWKIRNRER